MVDILDGQEISLPCEKCGRKTKKTIRWIKNNTQFTCACGTVIRLDTAGFKREIAKVEAAFGKLKGTFK